MLTDNIMFRASAYLAAGLSSQKLTFSAVTADLIDDERRILGPLTMFSSNYCSITFSYSLHKLVNTNSPITSLNFCLLYLFVFFFLILLCFSFITCTQPFIFIHFLFLYFFSSSLLRLFIFRRMLTFLSFFFFVFPATGELGETASRSTPNVVQKTGFRGFKLLNK